MSALRNVLKKNYSRIDGTVAVLVVGSAIVFSSVNLANASAENAPTEPTPEIVTVTVSGSAGQVVTVSGSTGIDIP